MKKIAFKNPKGGTIYLAKVGFDWGAFWAIFSLVGLPFFLRKMNVLGFFCVAFTFVVIFGMGLEQSALQESNLTILWQNGFSSLAYCLLILGLSLYLGFRGGKITARHYVEEGYKCITTDEALLTRAKAKWGLER